MQRRQLPQCSVTGASTGSGRSVRISPRKNIDPASRDSSSVCLPRQPSPAARANSTSSTGALSVQTRSAAPGAACDMRSASCCSRARSTL